MTKVCGETLSACLFEVGKIAIYHTIPTPCYFRHQYAGNPIWYVTKLDDECVSPRIEEIKTGFNSFYTVEVELDLYYSNSLPPFPPNPGTLVKCRYRILNVRGRIVEPFTVEPTDFDPSQGYPTTGVFSQRPNGTFFYTGSGFPYACDPSTPPSTSYAAIIDGRILSITRTSTTPDPTASCNIYAVPASGSGEFPVDTGEFCPTVVEIPCQYEVEKEKKQDGFIWFPLTSIQVINLPVEDNRLCTVVRASVANVTPPNPNNPLSWNGSPIVEELAKFCSPIGCEIYPKVCIDCDPKECPEGTCGVEDCNGNICCYNCDGKLVEVIKK